MYSLVKRLISTANGSLSLWMLGAYIAALGAAWMTGSIEIFLGALVLLAPLPAIAVARWVPAIAGQALHTMKAVAYREIEGRHYEHRGKPLLVFEDMEGFRWLAVHRVRAVVAGFPRDEVLMRISQGKVGRIERHSSPMIGLLIQAEGLETYLRQSQNPESVKFRNWLQRTVINPAEQARRQQRAGDARVAVSPSTPAPGDRQRGPAEPAFESTLEETRPSVT